jgi:phage/conjugal plasmid C-4 type zinc finger TraR family protein
MDEKFHEQASQLELDRREDALAEVRRKMGGPGRARCQDCREPIPRARRLAAPGAIRCIECQQRFEGMSK